MALLTFLVERPHRQMTFRMYVESHFIARNLFMREMPDQMAGNPVAEFPAEFVCKRNHLSKELVRCDVGSLVEVSLPLRERCTDVIS
jgi:hypothetical protein